jgi:hypothetical protein
MPLQEFDAPGRPRALQPCGDGRAGRLFRGVAAPELIASKAARKIGARCFSPASALLFADHFPRRPVFPQRCFSTARSAWR